MEIADDLPNTQINNYFYYIQIGLKLRYLCLLQSIEIHEWIVK